MLGYKIPFLYRPLVFFGLYLMSLSYSFSYIVHHAL